MFCGNTQAETACRGDIRTSWVEPGPILTAVTHEGCGALHVQTQFVCHVVEVLNFNFAAPCEHAILSQS